MKPWLPDGSYRYIASMVPMLCVDGIIGDGQGHFLLVKRTQPPFRGRWWVPGGLVRKGEKLEAAFRRKMREELGIVVDSPRLVGVFEIHHQDPRMNIRGGRHVVSVVFKEFRDGSRPIILDSTASEFKWADRLPRDFVIRESYTREFCE